MKPPFKASKPAAVNVNAGKKYASPPKGKVFDHVKAEGEELYAAAREEGSAPDHEVGGPAKEVGQANGEGHMQQPACPPAIPWPAAPGVDHKPFRMK